MGLFGSFERYKDQDYRLITRKARDSKKLFVDPEFPPNYKSLSTSPEKYANVEWKRPPELVKNPRLFQDGVSRDDVMQGNLGNCWFVAALSCLTSVKQYWHKVIPDYKSQEWNPEKPEEYHGVFKFQLWRFGRWTEVVVDDLLPTINGQLVFIRSKNGQEFWSALLEKAYAKLFGSYEALDGGRLTEALEDFTGGVSDSLDLVAMGIKSNPTARSQLYARLKREMDRNTLMGASIPASGKEDMEAVTVNGLVKGHAYGVTCVREITIKGSGLFGLFNREKLQMISLRNPWGNKEWTGPFSDGSSEWDKITSSDKKKIGLVKQDDGEFWMTFEDFCFHFERLDMCTLVNTSILSLSKTWHEGLAHGAWTAPNRAGGCSNHPTFLKNPQYAFDVTDDEDEFMVQLMQKSSRDKDSSTQGSSNKTIGFKILRVEWNRAFRMHDVSLHAVLPAKDFSNTRSLFSCQTDVKRGRYVIVPSTFEPQQTGEFLLRVYTSSSNNFMELKKECATKSCLNCCAKRPAMVTHINVLKATGLQKMDRGGGADPYVVIICEGKKVKGRAEKGTVDPEWKDSALFYRTDVTREIILQVWNRNTFRDQFMGQHTFKSHKEVYQEAKSAQLMGKDKERETVLPGKITFSLTQSFDLTAV